VRVEDGFAGISAHLKEGPLVREVLRVTDGGWAQACRLCDRFLRTSNLLHLLRAPASALPAAQVRVVSNRVAVAVCNTGDVNVSLQPVEVVRLSHTKPSGMAVPLATCGAQVGRRSVTWSVRLHLLVVLLGDDLMSTTGPGSTLA
jgi:hypothetical protein